MRRAWLWALAVFASLFLMLAWFVGREFVGGFVTSATKRSEVTPEQIERGEYLARIGNCAGCHTARGSDAYAGGRAVETPFGAVFAGNLTPDKTTGIGSWDSFAFYRAMSLGRS